MSARSSCPRPSPRACTRCDRRRAGIRARRRCAQQQPAARTVRPVAWGACVAVHGRAKQLPAPNTAQSKTIKHSL
eukprot:6067601-Pleurochrysis_carterae.AAC.1